ncbi:MAG: VC0807 family protein [Ilumatobacteraceae bacterium]
MNAHHLDVATPKRAGDDGSRAIVASVAVDLVAPVAAYYIARASGAGPTAALLIGAAIPALRAALTLARTRTVEWLAVIVLVVSLTAAGLSLLSGSARFLIAKDGAITLILGTVVLASTPTAQPALLTIGRSVVLASGHRTDSWDHRWSTSDPFRQIWRQLNIIWGAGLLVDAALRVMFAYTLPIDTVPAVTAVQWIVLLIALNLISQIHLRRPANRPLIFDDDDDALTPAS